MTICMTCYVADYLVSSPIYGLCREHIATKHVCASTMLFAAFIFCRNSERIRSPVDRLCPTNIMEVYSRLFLSHGKESV